MNFMTIPNSSPLKRSWPTWILVVGLLGIGIFLVVFWTLLPPQNGGTIYFFWLVQFFGIIFIPTLIFFPICMIIVALWLSRLAMSLSKRNILAVIGITASILSSLFVIWFAINLDNLIIVSHVEQNSHLYYLVKNYDGDLGIDFSFCKSDNRGFSGQCTYISQQFNNSENPEMYIDLNTQLVTIKAKNPSYIWVNSTPPTCVNDNPINAEEIPGGCKP